MGKAIRESSFGTRMGKSSEKKRLFLSVYVDDLKTGWEETQRGPNVKNVHERRWSGREPTSFLDHVSLGCTQRECETSKDIVDNYRNVWIQDLCRNKRKTSLFRETWRRHLLMVYGRSCKEMFGATLRAGEQNTPATVQSYNSMPWWPSNQRRRIGICWRIFKTYALKLSENAYILAHSMVGKQTCTCCHQVDQS